MGMCLGFLEGSISDLFDLIFCEFLPFFTGKLAEVKAKLREAEDDLVKAISGRCNFANKHLSSKVSFLGGRLLWKNNAGFVCSIQILLFK